MNSRIQLLFLLVAIACCGCGKQTKLPKPRPADPDPPEVTAPAPTPVVPPAVPAANAPPPVGSSQGLPAPVAVGGNSQGLEAPATKPAITLADPVAINIDILPLNPNQQFSVAEQRQLSLLRMRKLTATIASYVIKQGRLPPPAIFDGESTPVLSWRVHLLPYLGHADLHARFKLNEPWDSPHNVKLLPLIPPIYQSPYVRTEKTNYLVPLGPKAAFETFVRAGREVSEFKDGLGNTAVLVEVAAEMAVPWTCPQDYAYREGTPRTGLETLRDDGFLLGWGDGSVTRMPPTAPVGSVLAAYTIAGGELNPRNVTVPPASATPVGSAEFAPGEVDLPIPTASHSRGHSPTPPTLVKRQPLPDDAALDTARAHLKSLFHQDYVAAKTAADQLKLLERLRTMEPEIKPDPAAHYVLLDIVRQMALRAGDVAKTMQAIDDLDRHFEIAAIDLRLAALTELPKNVTSAAEARRYLDVAWKSLETARAQEQFVVARDLCLAAIGVAKKLRHSAAVEQLSACRQELETLVETQSHVANAMRTLDETPRDPKASLILGRYLCFVKGDWENGLPVLADSSNKSLQTLARTDLSQPSVSEQQVQLADGWWDLSRSVPVTERRQLQQRSRHWYEQSLRQLPAGFVRVKVQRRIEELTGPVVNPIRPAG